MKKQIVASLIFLLPFSYSRFFESSEEHIDRVSRERAQAEREYTLGKKQKDVGQPKPLDEKKSFPDTYEELKKSYNEGRLTYPEYFKAKQNIQDGERMDWVNRQKAELERQQALKKGPKWFGQPKASDENRAFPNAYNELKESYETGRITYAEYVNARQNIQDMELQEQSDQAALYKKKTKK